MYRVFIVLLYLRVVGCSEARRARGGAQCWTYSLEYLYKHFGEVNESGSPNLGTSPVSGSRLLGIFSQWRTSSVILEMSLEVLPVAKSIRGSDQIGC